MYNDGDDSFISDIITAAKANILGFDKKMGETESSGPLKEYFHSKMHGQFTDWVSARTENDPYWKFWADFGFRDMLS